MKNTAAPVPKGITVQQAAAALQYSQATIRRMIADGSLVAWKPHGERGRKWLIDEIALARWQAAMIKQARADAAPDIAALLAPSAP